MKKFTILIADDDEDDFMFIKEAFDELNTQHEFEHALDGEELMEKLNEFGKTQLPDLIILDINMPKMDGVAVLELIKSTKRFNLIPVFMHSTSNCPEQMKKCYMLGANGFITKNYSLKSLLNFARNINTFLKEINQYNNKFSDNFVP